MKNTSARASATIGSVAKKATAVDSRATQKSKSIVKPKPVVKAARAGSTPGTAAAAEKTARKTTTKEAKEVARTAKSPGATKTTALKVTTTKVTTTKAKASKAASAKDSVSTVKISSGATVRAIKKRAPKDLAAQYGETEKAPRKEVVKKAPRKRRDAAARARLQSVIAPDDALLLRLARAGAISSSLAPEGARVKPLRAVQTRRSRQWEAHCGKCGKSAFYRASAALCAGCGAILVREQPV